MIQPVVVFDDFQVVATKDGTRREQSVKCGMVTLRSRKACEALAELVNATNPHGVRAKVMFKIYLPRGTALMDEFTLRDIADAWNGME